VDETLLNAFLPSLLIFSSISVTLLVSIPKLKFWLKEEFEKKLTLGEISASDFFSFTYLFAFTQYLETIGILYLISISMVLSLPLFPELTRITYYYIVMITVLFMVYTVGSFFTAIRKTLASAKIFPLK